MQNCGLCDSHVVLAMLWFVPPSAPLPARQEAFSLVTSMCAILNLGGSSVVRIQLVWMDTSNDISSFLLNGWLDGWMVSRAFWTVVPWVASFNHRLKHWWGMTSYHSCHAKGGFFKLASPQMPRCSVVLTRSWATKRVLKSKNTSPK